jgi:hypothetical protein
LGLEDYFKRQVDQIGRALGLLLTGLLGLKAEGRFKECLELTSQTISAKTGIDFNELLSIPSASIPLVLKERYNWTQHNINSLGDIFYELADGAEDLDKEISRMYFEKALAIYEHLHKADTTYSIDRQMKIDEIKNILTQS